MATAACNARIARGKVAFANGKNYFYLEGRCGLATDEGDVCIACRRKNGACKIMENRQFDHGMIGEQIPVTSHIYGGDWYEAAVKIYGEPPKSMIDLANKAADRAKAEMDLKLCTDSGNNMKRRAGTIKKADSSGSGPAAAVAPEPESIPQILLIDFLEDEEVAEVDEVVYEPKPLQTTN
jgi:hypothetical protein